MRFVIAALAIAATTLAFVSAGQAQKPPKPPGQAAVTIKTSAPVIVFANPVTITGSVKRAKAGVPVTVERRATTETVFKPVATVLTDSQGDYRVDDHPSVNSVYRAIAATVPPAQSAETTVLVRPRVSFRVSDSTPSAGQRVRFRGTVRPQHDGRRVAIQRRRADGTWATVVRTRLRDAGEEFSRYRRRVRIRRTSTWRVRIAAHADHAAGFSRRRTLTVG
jgi:hypothetical protein